MGKRIVFFVCAALCALLVMFSREAATAAREGLKLFEGALLPALLPFFVCARIMLGCGALDPGDPVALFSLSFISGAPSGARLCGALDAKGGCSWGPSVMAASLNTLSPVFVCSAFASSMVQLPVAAVPLILSQLISALVCFTLCMKLVKPKREPAPKQAPFSRERGSLGGLFISSLTDAVTSLISIGGAVIFFCVLVAMLKCTGVMHILTWPFRMFATALGGDGDAVYPVLASILEAASGAGKLADAYTGGVISLRTLITAGAFAFSFGGLCIAVQSMLFLKLDLGRYLLVKLAQGALAALCAYILFPLCVRGAAEVSAMPSAYLENAASAAALFASSLFSMALLLLLCAVRRRRPVREKQRADASCPRPPV